MKAKHLVAVLLVALFVLPLALSPFLSGQLSGYDPWLDYNGDGVIDIYDLHLLGQAYGSTGDPARNVSISGYGWRGYTYDVSMAPLSSGNLNITTAGYSKVSLGFSVDAVTNPVDVRTGFVMGDYYTFVNALEVGGGAPSSHGANALWLDPPVLDLSGKSIGHRFFVTAYVNLSEHSHAWRVKVNFDPSYLKALQVGYTRSSKSQFFMNYSTVSSSPTIDNEAGYVIHEESLTTEIERPAGNGSLCYIEFEVVWPTTETALIIDRTEPSPPTYVLDVGHNPLPCSMYDSFISWFYATETYVILGPTLRIDFLNPNDVSAYLHVDAYLTTAGGKSVEDVNVTNWPLNQSVAVSNWQKDTFARNLILKGTYVGSSRLLVDYDTPYPNGNLPAHFYVDRDDCDSVWISGLNSTNRLVYNQTYVHDKGSLRNFLIYGNPQVSLPFNCSLHSIYPTGTAVNITLRFEVSLGLMSMTGQWTPLLQYPQRNMDMFFIYPDTCYRYGGLWFSNFTNCPINEAYVYLALRIVVYCRNLDNTDTPNVSFGIYLGRDTTLTASIPVIENS